MHPLSLYRAAFDLCSRQLGPGARAEVEVRVAPREEIARVTVRVPQALVGPATQEQEFFTLEVGDTGGTVEITNLQSTDRAVRVRAMVDGTTIRFFAAAANELVTTDLEVTFEAWELCSPTTGTAPYLHSTLHACFSVVDQRLPLLLTIITPETCTPRSTQGNHTLAYPSRLIEGRRHTNLYHSDCADVRIKYRFGSITDVTVPWLSLGKAAISAAFIFLVTFVASGVDPRNQFTALVAAFIAVATVLWDFVHEVTSFSIYDIRKNRINLFVILSQLLVICALVNSVLSLTGKAVVSAAWSVTISGCVAAFVGASAVVGLILHSRGWWHGFMCDHADCDQLLRIRRSRPECSFTGRVYCGRHIESVCGTCPHGQDLVSRTLESRNLFGTTDTPCGVRAFASKQVP